MTSTGSGSATATGTSPTHAIFQPMKPIMDGLLQIKSDTFVAWMGGIPNSDWTTLKISTDKPRSPLRSTPCLTTLALVIGERVWMLSLQKKEETCLVFNINYSGTSKTWVWTPLHTSRIWKIPPRW